MSGDAGGQAPLLPADTRLAHLPSCGSTNAEALARAMHGGDLPLWVLADVQTGGRGRAGRAWSSEPGNLLASLALPLAAPAAAVAQLSLVAGVAAVDAIRRSGPPIPGLSLKWPNDILVGGAKLGGILVEACATRAGPVAVIGIGLNLARAPAGLAAAATSLSVHGNKRKPLEMLAFLAEAMHEWLDLWQNGAGFAGVRAAWLVRCSGLGQRIAVHGAAGPLAGTFAGLDADGALLLAGDDGAPLRRITFGDVTILN